MNFSAGGQIKLSVIIAAWNGAAMLRECLSSLENQIDPVAIEVIVVSNFASQIETNATKFVLGNYIVLPAEKTVPELFARGIAHSSGEIIALSEDLCIFDENWCQAIIKAHQSGYSIIGGAVENAGNQSALDWAVYFYDYGKYMLPDQARTINTLSGMNISYKREILDQIHENYAHVFFENFVNEDLKRCGYELFFEPCAIIFHRKNYRFGTVASQFYYQARSFAAHRTINCSSIRRFLFLSFSLLLPALLLARIFLRITSKNRYFIELISAFPWLFILMNIWAFGEFCGYLVGKEKSRNK